MTLDRDALIRSLTRPAVPHVQHLTPQPRPAHKEIINEEEDIDSLAPVPLGYNQGKYYYLSREEGQIHEIPTSSHGPNSLMALARLSFWQQRFKGPKGPDWTGAIDYMMASCRKIGVFNHDVLRGRGVSYDKGRSILHLGNRLIVDGIPHPSLILDDSEFIYEKASPLKIKLGEPLSTDETYRILDICNMFSWATPDMGLLLAGWIVTAPVCGALPWRTHVWLTGQSGAGKAQPHSSNVLTPAGWRKMGELKEGDLVRTPDNNFARILKVHPQGKIDTFKITFADGRSTRSSADHLWKVRHGNEWRLRTTSQLIEMKEKDNIPSNALAIPVCNKIDMCAAFGGYGSNQKLPLHPYILGILLGDGHFANDTIGKMAGTISLTTYDSFIIDKCRNILGESFSTFYDTNHKHQYRFGDLSRYGRKSGLIIKELRLLGTRSHTKFIPKEYLSASIEKREELLRGLMDTDGTVGKNSDLSYCTVSEKLAEDVIYLVRSLGGIARKSLKKSSFTYRGEKKRGKDVYIIGIRFPDPSIAFSLPRKLEKISSSYQYKDSFYLRIDKIEVAAPEECSCLSIDHPDRLYITDDFIVTHNTYILSNFVKHLVGPIGLTVQSKTTEAGIRQNLRIDSRPIIFDEPETQNEKDRDRVQQVLDLARQASSEDGFDILKGTVTGREIRFRIRSSFMFSSINFGAIQSADENRIVPLTLVPMGNHHGAAEQFDNIKRMIKETVSDEFAGRLLSRTLGLLPTLRKNIGTFSRVLSNTMTSRQADTIGCLVAGVYSLYSDNILTMDEAEKFVLDRSWIKITAHRTETDNDHDKALNHLLEQIIRSSPGNEWSVAEALTLVKGNPDHAASSVLARHGIRIRDGNVFIGRSHSIIDKFFGQTPWARVWDKTILQCPGATPFNTTVDFAGTKKKAISIPLHQIITEEPILPAWSEHEITF